MISKDTLAVVGYASLDHPMSVTQPAQKDATSIVTGRLSEPWPVPGGALHLVRAASAAPTLGVQVVSWIGSDESGELWRGEIRATGAGATGVRVDGTYSPRAYLFYAQDGAAHCFFDPGDCHTPPLAVPQIEVLRQAGSVLLTVAPVWAVTQTLQEINGNALLIWAVKRDTTAFPPEVVDRLLRRADVVSASHGERELLTQGRPLGRRGQLLIETLGPQGVHFTLHSDDGQVREGHVTVDRVADVDTTGAGDTFIGTLAAGLYGIFPSPEIGQVESAVTHAARTTARMLASRAGSRAHNKIDRNPK
ncbi:MAG: carbohydrate kinase family protein [Streptosporangiaceae bacterium]